MIEPSSSSSGGETETAGAARSLEARSGRAIDQRADGLEPGLAAAHDFQAEFVVLVEGADLLRVLVLDQLGQRRPDLVVVGREERELEPVERLVHLARGRVHQTLNDEIDFRAPRAAIGLRRRGVGEHRAGAQGRERNVVRARHEARAFAQRRERHATRADIADVVATQAQNAAVFTQRQFHARRQIAALIIAQEAFRARGVEFHRAPDAL